jgi:hypothetical protein
MMLATARGAAGRGARTSPSNGKARSRDGVSEHSHFDFEQCHELVDIDPLTMVTWQSKFPLGIK